MSERNNHDESRPMIRLEHVSNTFSSGAHAVHAMVDVSLSIPKGSIFGIIGFSGAGKSTLVRCLNLLEMPTEGHVYVDGEELTALSNRKLRAQRRKIGMIFQLFNLMSSRTIYGNVVFPLSGPAAFLRLWKKEAAAYRERNTGSGAVKAALSTYFLTFKNRRRKVVDLLNIVGLKTKLRAYPSQLSGGQKQRVAIARALASDPKVLLCDEATSALDPQTTQDILELIKKLNRELGITTIVITHEMAVVKQICDNVAVMEDGRVVETGDIYSIFSDPQMPITRRFIGTTDGASRAKEQLSELLSPLNLSKGDKVIQLSFHGESSGHALVSKLSREYNIDISIIYGNIEMLDGKPLGKLVTIFSGSHNDIEKALASIGENNVKAEVMYDAQ